MVSISRNKKITLFSLVVLSLTLVWLYFTGNLSFSGLKSSMLNQACTVQSHKNQLPRYTQALIIRDEAQKRLDKLNGELEWDNSQIVRKEFSITEKQSEVNQKTANIAELMTLLEKSCQGWPTVSSFCEDTFKQRKNLIQEIENLKKDLRDLHNDIRRLSERIKSNQRKISARANEPTFHTSFINQYEACDRQLNAESVLTPPVVPVTPPEVAPVTSHPVVPVTLPEVDPVTPRRVDPVTPPVVPVVTRPVR